MKRVYVIRGASVMFVRGMCIFLSCVFFKITINVVLFSTGEIMQKYFNVRSNLRLIHV